MNNITLSVCIIVKDNSEYLPNAIESVKDIASEIIIINTGSNDNCRGVLHTPIMQCTSPIKIFNFPWNDNFSDAKNESLKHATQDWILIFEAEYTLDEISKKILLNSLKKDNDIYFVKVLEIPLPDEKFTKYYDINETDVYIDVSLHPLLFRNGKGIKFENRVHENIIYIDWLKKEISEISINHYFTNDSVNKKISDEKRLLKLSLENDNLSLSQKIYFKTLLLSSKMEKDISEIRISEIKEEIIDLNSEIEKNISDKEISKFENWYHTCIDFLLNSTNDYKYALNTLIKSVNYFGLSVPFALQFNEILLKTGRKHESLQITKYIKDKVKSKTALTVSGVPLDNKLLEPDYMEFSLASINYNLGDYEAFEFYKNNINKKHKYLGQINKLKANNSQVYSSRITGAEQLRIAMEHISELEYKDAKTAFLEALKLSFIEENILLQQSIMRHMLVNAKHLMLDEETLNELMYEFQFIGENDSLYWYSLGKYYFSVGKSNESLNAFNKSLEIEQSKNIQNYDNNSDLIDYIIKNTQNEFILFEIKKHIQTLIEIKEEQTNLEEIWNKKKTEKAEEKIRAKAFYKIFNPISKEFTLNIDEYEFNECIREIEKLNPSILLVIGVSIAGILLTLLNFTGENTLIIGISLSEADKEELTKIKQNQKLLILNSAPGTEKITSQLKEIIQDKKIDILFIDSNNNYEEIKKIHEIFSKFVSDNGIIVFNNIQPNYIDKSRAYFEYLSRNGINVNEIIKPQIPDFKNEIFQFWKELIIKYPTKEIKSSDAQEFNGIGILYKTYKEKKLFDQFNFVSIGFEDSLSSYIRFMYLDNIKLLKLCFMDLGIKYKHTFNQGLHGYNNIIFSPCSDSKLSNYFLDFTYIPFQMEQLMHFTYLNEGYMRLLKSAKCIWDYSESNISFLNSIDYNNSLFLPFGFHPKMEVLDFNKNKTIDVLFYGVVTERRKYILDQLSLKGYKVVVITGLYGSERNSFIEKSKIVLNIHMRKNSLLEEHRISFLVNNRCFLISEKPEILPKNSYGDGVVFSEYDKIVENCEFYLKPENDLLRKSIAENGYNIFSRNKMTDNLKKVLINLQLRISNSPRPLGDPL